jgi:hypothetical protein
MGEEGELIRWIKDKLANLVRHVFQKPVAKLDIRTTLESKRSQDLHHF